MKSIRLICYFCVFAGVMNAETILAVNAPDVRETRRSSTIAPSSGISVELAEDAVAGIKRMVPGTKVYSVRPTGSMRPLFDGNCLILTERAAFEDLDVGDIVVYRHSRTSKLVVHRILERRGNAYWTKGDKNTHMDDELVTPENYQARLYGIIYTERSNDNMTPTARKNLSVLAAAN
jgi:signal peptidase I